MNVEFIVHGVISGQSFSKQGDIEYCKQFYGPQDAGKLMTMEVAKGPSGVCSYYNYLRSGNVVAEREGSYFGMTVRIDGYLCTDEERMWMVLDCVFQKAVVGRILRPLAGKYKYCIDSFQCVAVTEVENRFLSLFGSSFNSDDFRPISEKDISLGAECVRFNPEDVTEGFDVDGCIRRGVKIYLSPSYPSVAEVNLKKECDASIARVKRELSDAQRRVKELQEAGRPQVDGVGNRPGEGKARPEEQTEGEGDDAPEEGLNRGLEKWIKGKFHTLLCVMGFNCLLTLAVLIFLVAPNIDIQHCKKTPGRTTTYGTARPSVASVTNAAMCDTPDTLRREGDMIAEEIEY